MHFNYLNFLLISLFSLHALSCLGYALPGRPSLHPLRATTTSLCTTNANNIPQPTESSNQTTNIPDLALGWKQLKPFLNIAVPFFKKDKTARNSLLALSALTLINSGISVAFSYVSRDFYNALNMRDEGLFYQKTELFFLATLIAVPVSVYYRFVRERLSLYWREALTANALQLYYSNRTYYALETLREVDNPDQRISEDIRHFTKTSLDFFITIFTSIVDLISFSAILFQIFPGLFVAVIVYAGIGSIIASKLGRSLVGLNYEKLLREANFRFALFRTRENAEAIAFYDSDAVIEQKTVWQLFQEALETQFGIIKVQRNLEYFTTGYRYLVQIIPSLIVAPLYFAHKVELGAISQSYGAFNHILSDFSIIINQFEALSAFAAGLTRLSSFFDRMGSSSGHVWGEDKPLVSLSMQSLSSELEGAVTESSLSDQTPSLRSVSPLLLLACRNLTVLTPDAQRVLLGNLHQSASSLSGVDIDVMQGDRLLIVGPSGAGKSSFVRTIAGLWQVGRGQVIWDRTLLSSDDQGNQTGVIQTSQQTILSTAPKEVFFLPQKPYNLLGDLRQQIMYPRIHSLAGTLHDDSNLYGDSKVLNSRKKKVKPVEEGDKAAAPIGDIAEDDEFFLNILQKVQLGHLAGRMGEGDEHKGLRVSKDWSKTLSLGEQQRLAFARILYNRPRVVVLDEATSALDLNAEAAMYTLLLDETPNITFISVGHRPSLVRFHNKKLILGGEGVQPRLVSLLGTKIAESAL
eukprot:scaffold9977_cov169-Ochromonas_danica.AAC.1